MWNPLRVPRPIPHLASRRFLRELLKRPSVPHAELKTVAESIVREHIRGETFLDKLQAYVNVCESIDDAKVKVGGHEFVSVVGNGLMQFIAGLVTADVRFTDADIVLTNELAEKVRAEWEWSWMYPKLAYLARGMSSRLRAEWLARSLHLDPALFALLERLEKALGTDIDRQIDEIVEALHEHRDYGIKPAVFGNGIKPRPEHVWLVTDAMDTRRPQMDLLGYHDDLLAWFFLTEKKYIANTESQVQQIPLAQKGAYIELLGPDVSSHVGWLMDRHGHFSLDQNRLLPAHDVFRREKKEREFSILRLMSVVQLYDLTVPIKVVRRMPKLPDGGLISRFLGKDPVSEVLNPTLLIPRIKELFGNRAALLESLLQEVEASVAATERRSLRRHECVGHVRELPAGRRATPEAIERAREEGIRLQPNETFVRKHERGSRGKKLGPHLAIQRHS